MTTESSDEKGPTAQDAETDEPGTRRPYPRRRIILTASLLGLLALAFYVAEIIVVAFDLVDH